MKIVIAMFVCDIALHTRHDLAIYWQIKVFDGQAILLLSNQVMTKMCILLRVIV